VAAGAAVAWGVHVERAAPRVDAVGAASSQTASVPGSSGPTLVIIPGSQNLTVDAVFDGTLEPILESALKRSATLYPYAGPSMRGLASELAPGVAGNEDELGRILAEKQHARVVMARPAVAPDGTAYRIAVVAKEGATGRQIAEIEQRAETLADIVPAVARAACALRVKLGDAPCEAGTEERVGLSSSIEADHRFMVGRNALWAGKYDDSVNQFQKAIAIDPGFVMAHQQLAFTLMNLSRPEESRRFMKYALAHKDGLSEREALEVSATYHIAMDEYDQARDDYLNLLKGWPAESHFRSNLAICYVEMGQIEEALEEGRRIAEEHPQLLNARANVPSYLIVAGHLEEADRETKAVLASLSHLNALVYTDGIVSTLLLGKRDEALALLEPLKATSAPVALLTQADVAIFEGRLDDAVTTLKDGIAADEGRKRTPYAETTWATLAEALARRGDMTQAREAAAHAAKSNDVVTLFRAARVLARGGQASEARALERLILANSGVRAPLFARIVEADALLAEHAPKEAVVKAMGEPGRGAGSWIARFDLGQAYFELGDFEDAERELAEAVASEGAGAVAFFEDIPTLRYLPPARYLLARAKDALHRPDAKAAYEAFLAREPHAQRDPLAAEARKRLAAL
jgi:tetratricopeptide (TPR) repeat protein